MVILRVVLNRKKEEDEYATSIPEENVTDSKKEIVCIIEKKLEYAGLEIEQVIFEESVVINNGENFVADIIDGKLVNRRPGSLH